MIYDKLQNPKESAVAKIFFYSTQFCLHRMINVYIDLDYPWLLENVEELNKKLRIKNSEHFILLCKGSLFH